MPGIYAAMYDFEPELETEMKMTTGDVVTVFSRQCAGWVRPPLFRMHAGANARRRFKQAGSRTASCARTSDSFRRTTSSSSSKRRTNGRMGFQSWERIRSRATRP